MLIFFNKTITTTFTAIITFCSDKENDIKLNMN